jgi:hypothetical protein
MLAPDLAPERPPFARKACAAPFTLLVAVEAHACRRARRGSGSRAERFGQDDHDPHARGPPRPAGSAAADGVDVAAEPELVAAGSAGMSQRFGLYDDLTVGENLRFYAGIYGLRGEERAARLEELVAELGFGERLTQLAGT